MNGALDILRRERDEAAEQIRVLRARIKDLDAALALLEGQPAATRPGRGARDLKAIVLRKLQEVGAVGGSPKEIADALTSDGRPTSDASVSSTLSRLKGESKVINRSGRWFAANSANDSRDSDFDSLAPDRAESWDELDEDVPF